MQSEEASADACIEVIGKRKRTWFVITLICAYIQIIQIFDKSTHMQVFKLSNTTRVGAHARVRILLAAAGIAKL